MSSFVWKSSFFTSLWIVFILVWILCIFAIVHYFMMMAVQMLHVSVHFSSEWKTIVIIIMYPAVCEMAPSVQTEINDENMPMVSSAKLFSCTYVEIWVWSELDHASLTSYYTNHSSSISSWAACVTSRPISRLLSAPNFIKPSNIDRFSKFFGFLPLVHLRETWPVHYHHHHYFLSLVVKVNLLLLLLLAIAIRPTAKLQLLFTFLAEVFTVCRVLITACF